MQGGPCFFSNIQDVISGCNWCVHVREKGGRLCEEKRLWGGGGVEVESESLDSSLFIVAGLSDQLAERSNEKQMDGSLCVCVCICLAGQIELWQEIEL